MLNKKDVSAEIDGLTTLRELVEAYEEIAANHMRRIRNSVLKTRDFLTGLTEIFQEVKSSYKHEILLLQKMKNIKNEKLSVVKRNGKTVSLLLSSNTGLYGDIVKKTFQTFCQHLKNTETDITVVGRLGYVLFKEQYPNKQITYFDFPDSTVDMDRLKEIIQHLMLYEKVLVFYGQFQSLVNQAPAKLDVYGDVGEKPLPVSEIRQNGGNAVLKGGLSLNKEKAVEGGAIIKYLFEPTLENIMLFFEAEIIGSIFEQTIHESNLAKFAARMLTLDKATVNIRDRLSNSQHQKRIVAHRIMNKKQLEGLSGFSLWGK